MSRAADRVIPPDLEPPLNYSRFLGEISETRGELYEMSFADLVWREQCISGVQFNHVAFDKVDFGKSKLRDVSFSDARLKSCELSNADWTGIDACRVEIMSSRLVGLNSAEGKYRHVLFQNCRAEYAVFQFSRLESCRFENCNLLDATFEAARLKRVVFRKCDLTNSRFIGAQLEDIDLRGSRIDGIGLPAENLKDLTIDLVQSPVIAALTGAKIVELEET